MYFHSYTYVLPSSNVALLNSMIHDLFMFKYDNVYIELMCILNCSLGIECIFDDSQ